MWTEICRSAASRIASIPPPKRAPFQASQWQLGHPPTEQDKSGMTQFPSLCSHHFSSFLWRRGKNIFTVEDQTATGVSAGSLPSQAAGIQGEAQEPQGVGWVLGWESCNFGPNTSGRLQMLCIPSFPSSELRDVSRQCPGGSAAETWHRSGTTLCFPSFLRLVLLQGTLEVF